MKILYLIIGLVLISVYIYYENNTFGITQYKISSNKISKDFDKFKIIQVSDLHNQEFGKGNDDLVNSIKKESPNIIVITGDIVDGNRTNINIAVGISRKLVNIAPTYYVTGNHEYWIGFEKYNELETKLKNVGVKVLRNNVSNIKLGQTKINLIGLDDMEFLARKMEYNVSDDNYIMSNKISEIKDKFKIDDNNFSILLSHRPDLVRGYKDTFDLVLSGHAHGGQFRIPLLGGVFAPNQGFFPKYSSGMNDLGNTRLIISRGLGNSRIPLRINNRPEVLSIVLESK